MPRVKVLTDEEVVAGAINHLNLDEWLRIEYGKDFEFPVEKKSDSFGWLHGKLVIIDYGS